MGNRIGYHTKKKCKCCGNLLIGFNYSRKYCDRDECVRYKRSHLNDTPHHQENITFKEIPNGEKQFREAMEQMKSGENKWRENNVRVNREIDKDIVSVR